MEQVMQHQSASSSSYKIFVYSILWLIAAPILILGIIFFQKNNRHDEQNPTEMESTSTEVIVGGEIKVIPKTRVTYLASPVLLRTVRLKQTHTDIRAEVFKIGEIAEGVWKGKNLARMEFIHNENNYGSPYDDRGQHAYFIADDKGLPVMWNSDFYNFNEYGDFCDQSLPSDEGLTCGDAEVKKILGFIRSNEKSLEGVIPSEFIVGRRTLHPKKNSFLTISSSAGEQASSILGATTPIDVFDSSFSLVKQKRELQESHTFADILSPFTYYLRTPFGIDTQIFIEPNFIKSDDTPELTWTFGTTTVASYRYGQYAYGWEDCYDEVKGILEQNFIETGKTIHGDQIFEIDAKKNPSVYHCLHQKTNRYMYDEKTQKSSSVESVSYSEFITTHPMFFWKHQYGDWIAFVRSDVVPAAEKAKPVIYLYPETTKKVKVYVNPIGGLSVTDPTYTNGWDVTVTPESLITTHDGKTYPYLFWEGGKDGVVRTPQTGFVIAKDDIKGTLNEKLALLGLNERERNDFLEFWVPKLSHAPYYFITFIPREEIDRVAPMTITPRPDTVIRVLMDYKPLTTKEEVSELMINTPERKGFSVVEWGGILHDPQ